ncbi:uncharacterized protein LOC135484121 [Lineus longissimus]|uniref:uncharacterized protein LOC135484121 n=1 Tax=Lineus longissimus TaxID=88925 RepID=UPI00315C7237
MDYQQPFLRNILMGCTKDLLEIKLAVECGTPISGNQKDKSSTIAHMVLQMKLKAPTAHENTQENGNFLMFYAQHVYSATWVIIFCRQVRGRSQCLNGSCKGPRSVS